MLQLLREAKTHISIYTRTPRHTATIVVFGVSPWKQPVQQRSHTAAHWFTASPCFQLAVGFGSASQDKVSSQQAAFVLSVALSSLPWRFCKTEMSCRSRPLCFVTANKYYAHDAPTKRLLPASDWKPSVRESPTQTDVWNPACRHLGLCCSPDAICLHSCGAIVSLVHLWSEINTVTHVWPFEISEFKLESKHSIR